MPARPAWYGKINHVITQLQALSRPFVDRATVEFLLGVGRRRAQQIMAPCITDRVGANGLADTGRLIEHLRRLAQGDDGYYEIRRRQKFAEVLAQLQEQAIRQPRLLVEAPVEVLAQELENLPVGVRLAPGCITIAFGEPREALEKLLALAMAISNDFQGFERQVRPGG